ncbi:hypothetical protein ACH0AH_02815 [Microbacterium paludicola]|uniref:hypothetical protein n=1 Tax=Microbacterium paludicola TaxID=300019 RepID=UPI0038797594
MKRIAVCGLAVLAAALTGCSPAPSSGADVEARILHALPEDGDSGEVRMVDILPDARWDRLTVGCPYEEAWEMSERLQAWSGSVPDLAQRDDAQAIVLARGDAVERAWLLGRDELDLCGSGAEPEVLARDEAVLSFTRDADGHWVADWVAD